MPYIEVLGDFWGELCVTPELALTWAAEFQPVVEQRWNPSASGHGFFQGTSACFSALFAAGRHEQLLALLARAPFKGWHYRRWGVKALAAMGKRRRQCATPRTHLDSTTPAGKSPQPAKPFCARPASLMRPIEGTQWKLIRAPLTWQRFAPSPRTTRTSNRPTSCAI